MAALPHQPSGGSASPLSMAALFGADVDERGFTPSIEEPKRGIE